MRLLWGHLWELSIHSPRYWKEEMRDETDPPVIPYISYKRTMPYGPFEHNGVSYTPVGTYFFPFALRTFRTQKTDS